MREQDSCDIHIYSSFGPALDDTPSCGFIFSYFDSIAIQICIRMTECQGRILFTDDDLSPFQGFIIYDSEAFIKLATANIIRGAAINVQF